MDRGHVEIGALEEQRHRKLRHAAEPARSVAQLARLRAHIGDEFGDGLHRQLAVHHQHERIGPEHADRRQVLDRVIGHLGHGRQDHDLRLHAPQQRVAVGGRARDAFDRDRAAGAGAVLDHELLAEHVAEALRDDARHAVGVAAGRERHDDLHRPVRPVLGLRRAGSDGAASNQATPATHFQIGMITLRNGDTSRRKLTTTIGRDATPEIAPASARRNRPGSASPPGSAKAATAVRCAD